MIILDPINEIRNYFVNVYDRNNGPLSYLKTFQKDGYFNSILKSHH
jgi:hypothetical protein